MCQRAQTRQHIVIVPMEVQIHCHAEEEISQVMLLVGTGDVGVVVKETSRVALFNLCGIATLVMHRQAPHTHMCKQGGTTKHSRAN